MLAFTAKALETLLEWENIKPVLSIMVNGPMTQETVMVFMRIRLLDINMLETGSRIESMDLADKSLWWRFMKANFSKIKKRDLESW